MLKYVHHVHYVVRNRAEIVAYLEKNFGMKPDELVEIKRGLKDAIYDIGKTHIQISEPSDPDTGMGKFLATNGPGVYHVAWAVDDIRKLAKDLLAKGNKMRGQDGITTSERGYLMSNIELESSHGLWVQLADGDSATASAHALDKPTMLRYVHHVHYVVRNRAEIVAYLEKNFGMKADEVIEIKRGLKDAIYDIGKTHIQISEPSDPNTGMGKFLATNGPGVYHVAWAVDDIRNLAKDLLAKGNKMRGKDGITTSERGYLMSNIELESSHGLWLQLAEGGPPAKH